MKLIKLTEVRCTSQKKPLHDGVIILQLPEPSQFCFVVQIRLFFFNKTSLGLPILNIKEKKIKSGRSSKKTSSRKWPDTKGLFSAKVQGTESFCKCSAETHG